MKKVTNAQREENLKKVAPLNQYLKDNHISQSDVAQKSGLHLGTINRILHGWQPLMPNTLQRIADALGVEYYILNERVSSISSLWICSRNLPCTS